MKIPKNDQTVTLDKLDEAKELIKSEMEKIYGTAELE